MRPAKNLKRRKIVKLSRHGLLEMSKLQCPKGRKAEDGTIDPKYPLKRILVGLLPSTNRMECPG
jgi:hypothetical protein